jgi:hypothetical protein
MHIFQMKHTATEYKGRRDTIKLYKKSGIEVQRDVDHTAFLAATVPYGHPLPAR